MEEEDDAINVIKSGLGESKMGDVLPPERLARRARRMNLSRNGFLKIEGLEECTLLEELNLSYNRIVRLEGLSSLGLLRVLSLRENSVHRLEGLRELTMLEELDVSGNNIGTLSDLQGVTSLLKLNVSKNDLTAIEDISFLSHLTSLDISHNSIPSLGEAKRSWPRSLRKLSIAGNPIERGHSELVVFSNFPVLRDLDIRSAAAHPPSYNEQVLALFILPRLTRLNGVSVDKEGELFRMSQRLFVGEDGVVDEDALMLLEGGHERQLSRYLEAICPSVPEEETRERNNYTQRVQRLAEMNQRLRDARRRLQSNSPEKQRHPSSSPPRMHSWVGPPPVMLGNGYAYQPVVEPTAGLHAAASLLHPPYYGPEGWGAYRAPHPGNSGVHLPETQPWKEDIAALQKQVEALQKMTRDLQQHQKVQPPPSSTIRSRHAWISHWKRQSHPVPWHLPSVVQPIDVQHAAAVCIQAWWRSVSVHRVWKQVQQQEKSATRIQAMWRGWSQRKAKNPFNARAEIEALQRALKEEVARRKAGERVLRALWEQLHKDDDLQQVTQRRDVEGFMRIAGRSAVLIQRVVRGFLVRKRLRT